MRFWWVNQNQTFRAEVGGGYLWSPKRKSNGGRNPFYEFMREVSPGDLIFSFADTWVPATGIAVSHAYEAAKPDEFGSAGANWDQLGWRVDVAYTELDRPLRPKDHMGVIGPLLPDKYAPLQPNGNGLQSVYLTELPEDLASTLIDLIRAADNAIQDVIDDPNILTARDRREEIYEKVEQAIETTIASSDMSSTEKEQLVQSRRGQGVFKKNIKNFETGCRVTGVTNAKYLIASHIKPWRSSDNRERLDGANGLLLAPHVDFLFDRGLISFADDGRLIVSPAADQDSLQRLQIQPSGIATPRPFQTQQLDYMAYHRREVLLLIDR